MNRSFFALFLVFVVLLLAPQLVSAQDLQLMFGPGGDTELFIGGELAYTFQGTEVPDYLRRAGGVGAPGTDLRFSSNRTIIEVVAGRMGSEAFSVYNDGQSTVRATLQLADSHPDLDGRVLFDGELILEQFPLAGMEYANNFRTFVVSVDASQIRADERVVREALVRVSSGSGSAYHTVRVVIIPESEAGFFSFLSVPVFSVTGAASAEAPEVCVTDSLTGEVECRENVFLGALERVSWGWLLLFLAVVSLSVFVWSRRSSRSSGRVALEEAPVRVHVDNVRDFQRPPSSRGSGGSGGDGLLPRDDGFVERTDKGGFRFNE